MAIPLNTYQVSRAGKQLIMSCYVQQTNPATRENPTEVIYEQWRLRLALSICTANQGHHYLHNSLGCNAATSLARLLKYHYIALDTMLRWLSWMRRPTGDQEVVGSTPAEVSNILSWRLIMKYFLGSFSPFRWFKKGSCQFLTKECAQYWLTT